MFVGVLALQGSFHEHIAALRKLGVDAIEVRKPEHLDGISGLIIPGGESTTMAKLAEQYKLIPALKEFVASGKPTWGTCAGLIFLANKAIGQKKGGQELLGGLDCIVHRNFFGSQVNSFETELIVPALAAAEGGPPGFRAVFIRAPAILETGPSVEVLADCTIPSIEAQKGNGQFGETVTVTVAVRQGNLLATAFHPELTSDTRWHSFFLNMLKEKENPNRVIPQNESEKQHLRQQIESKDLPIFQETECLRFEI
eukprot:c20104_g1_i1 orf=82-846(+)